MIGARKKKFTPKMRFHMIYNTRHQSRWKLLTDSLYLKNMDNCLLHHKTLRSVSPEIVRYKEKISNSTAVKPDNNLLRGVKMNINILGISELKWKGMGEFNSDDDFIYYCEQEYLRRN